MYKQKPILIMLTILCLCLFYGCKDNSVSSSAKMSTNNAEDNSSEFIKVNDINISNKKFKQYANAKRIAQPEADFSDTDIINEIIAAELLYQEAIKQGIATRVKIKQQIKQQEKSILINTLLTEKFSNINFTDEELKSEYNRLIFLNDSSEYKARHILLKTNEDANAVIEELRGGTDFIELAKQKSQGPSAPNGGDLGWFKADTMVPPFAQALQLMEKGSHSLTPVQTRFGWHVILLEDKRSSGQPAFESVKQDLQRSLTQKSIESYVNELQNNATIVRPSNNESSDS